MNIEKKLKSYIESLINAINVDSIILFGSYAKGNATEYSDIDLAIVSSDVNPLLPRWDNIKLIKEKANIKFDPDLQIIPFTPQAFYDEEDSPIQSFINEIKKNGKVIYSNNKHS